MSKLLIIGNGFDLRCGLKSQYIDFWRYQRNNHDSFNRFIDYLEKNSVELFDEEKLNGIESILKVENDISFLDIYFTLLDWANGRLNKNKVWSNVEDMLLFGFQGNESSNAFDFDSCCSCYDETLAKNRFLSYKDSFPHQIMSKYLFKVFEGKEINYHQYRAYVLSELEAFSVCFSKYIAKQVEEKQDYYKLAQELILNITKTTLNGSEIVSFNYTEPIIGRNLANIHGLASKRKIVIGITCDGKRGKEEVHRSWYYKATKEYKITNISASGIKVSTNYIGISDVYIYGLSLGKQDYDFFDNLFDEFNIIARPHLVKIHFCYSAYDGKSKDEVATETTNRVTSLINRYGDSHKNYGLLRNLIQKGYLVFDYIE